MTDVSFLFQRNVIEKLVSVIFLFFQNKIPVFWIWLLSFLDIMGCFSFILTCRCGTIWDFGLRSTLFLYHHQYQRCGDRFFPHSTSLFSPSPSPKGLFLGISTCSLLSLASEWCSYSINYPWGKRNAAWYQLGFIHREINSADLCLIM